MALSDSPEPAETEAPGAEATTSDKSGTALDFSACDGLTGLDIAICRHQSPNDFGGYRGRIPDRVGLYRAVAVRESLSGGADTCARDRSPTVRHRD